MKTQISIDAKDLMITLNGINEALDDLRPAWKDVHDIFLEFERKVFETEGGYASADWEPLNPAYAAYKTRIYGAKTIMRRDDRLYKSLTSRTSQEHVYNTGPSFIEMGTRTLYARAQHFGYEKTGLPARPLIPQITREEGERIVDAIMIHLLKSGRGALRAGKREVTR